MSANILIKKYLMKDKRVYYYVQDVDTGGPNFYVEVIPHEMKINFYRDVALRDRFGEMDLSDPHMPYQEINGLNFNVTKRVAFQVAKAMRASNFLDDISYISH
jgi:hypothetical protein